VTAPRSVRVPCVRRTRLGPVAAVAKTPTRVPLDTPSRTKTKTTLSTAFALVAAVGVLTLTAPVALANVKYANDCDPICHILDDGAAKSKKQEEDMKKAGPDLSGPGSMMAELQAARKAEEAAAKAKK